ncbi:hypothetical protein [Chlamydiifrater volucris]|uniref:hypothetical protein n=1 Tax=Chlamydiifrater volucris TaxID=2681470 RepID=UPI001BCAAEDC|nr:hypothetical protein [Chlamydiifrater volucris]
MVGGIEVSLNSVIDNAEVRERSLGRELLIKLKDKVCLASLLTLSIAFATISAASLIVANFSIVSISISLVSFSLFLLFLFKFFSFSLRDEVIEDDKLISEKEFKEIQNAESQEKDIVFFKKTVDKDSSTNEESTSTSTKSEEISENSSDGSYPEELLEFAPEDLLEYSALSKRGAKAVVSTIFSSVSSLGSKMASVLKDESFRAALGDSVHKVVEGIYVLAAGESSSGEGGKESQQSVEKGGGS